MPKEFDGSTDEQWNSMLKWMRALPTMFRLTRIPLIGRYLFRDSFVGDPTAMNWVIPIRQDISRPDNVHLPLDVLRPMIEGAAYRFRLAKCICRSAFDCQEYPHDVACIGLGSAFEDVDSSGWGEILTEEEALEQVEKAVSLGLVPTIIWDNDVELMGGASRDSGVIVCLCCDCCCDVRLGLRMGNKDFRKKVIRPEGVSLVVSDGCDLCGMCAEPDVCSVGAITLGSTKAQIDLDECVGCGHCVAICPTEVISFHLDPEVDIIGKLIAQVEAVTDIT